MLKKGYVENFIFEFICKSKQKMCINCYTVKENENPHFYLFQ